MSKTYKAILDDLNEKRSMWFSSDPEREEVMRVATTLAIVSILEKLAASEDLQ